MCRADCTALPVSLLRATLWVVMRSKASQMIKTHVNTSLHMSACMQTHTQTYMYPNRAHSKVCFILAIREEKCTSFFSLVSATCSHNGTSINTDTCVLDVHAHSQSPDIMLTSCSCSFVEMASGDKKQVWLFFGNAVQTTAGKPRRVLDWLFLICSHTCQSSIQY